MARAGANLLAVPNALPYNPRLELTWNHNTKSRPKVLGFIDCFHWGPRVYRWPEEQFTLTGAMGA